MKHLTLVLLSSVLAAGVWAVPAAEQLADVQTDFSPLEIAASAACNADNSCLPIVGSGERLCNDRVSAIGTQ